MSGRIVRVWLPALLAIAVALALLVVLTDRYGPVGPGEPGWKVSVTNDTSLAVTVSTSAEALRLPPGVSDLFVAPGPGVLRFSLTIRPMSGEPVTCLPVVLSKTRTTTAKVSDARPC